MTKAPLIRLAGVLTTLTAFTCAASAQITYVDATHGASGNTTLVGGAQWNPLAVQGPANDTFWDVRAFGNGATIYQNGQTNAPDDAHRLMTTVSGLTAGTYDVYAYYWSSNDGGGTGSWVIRAGLDGGADPLPLFNPTLATGFYDPAGNLGSPVLSNSLAENPFSTDVMIAQNNRRLYQAYLGQVTGTSFNVFLDDLPKTSTDGTGRTWFDGVGYAAVPEPSTYALFFGLGALAFVGSRRRR